MDVTLKGPTSLRVFKDKEVQFNAEVSMVDKNTNSLKQLNGFIDKLTSMFIASKEAEKKEVDLKAF